MSAKAVSNCHRAFVVNTNRVIFRFLWKIQTDTSPNGFALINLSGSLPIRRTFHKMRSESVERIRNSNAFFFSLWISPLLNTIFIIFFLFGMRCARVDSLLLRVNFFLIVCGAGVRAHTDHLYALNLDFVWISKYQKKKKKECVYYIEQWNHMCCFNNLLGWIRFCCVNFVSPNGSTGTVHLDVYLRFGFGKCSRLFDWFAFCWNLWAPSAMSKRGNRASSREIHNNFQ